MKKFIFFLILLLTLCSCSYTSEDTLFNKLNSLFSTKSYIPKKTRVNTNTSYYGFHLPSDIFELENDENYHHFVFGSSDFFMNLNVDYVLCKDIFSTEPTNPFTIFKDHSIYHYDSSDNNEYISFDLYRYYSEYYFSLYTDKMLFFGETNLSDAYQLVHHVLGLNNSVILKTMNIYNDFYSGTIINDSYRESVDFFNTYIPPDGVLSDLLPSD